MLQRDFNGPDHLPQCHLSITFTINQLNYAIFDQDGVMLHHTSLPDISFNSAATIQALKDDAKLNMTFANITVVAMTCNAHQLSFKDERISSILPSLEFKNIKIEKIPGSAVYNYYGLTQAQENLLKEILHNQQYNLYNFVFTLSSYFIGIERPLVHLHLEEKLLTIFIQKDGVLQFFNSYGYKSSNDILYFVMAACKMNEIDLVHDQKTVSGWIEKDSEIFNSLTKFLGNLNIIEDTTFKIQSSPNHKPHYYFAHYAGKACV